MAEDGKGTPPKEIPQVAKQMKQPLNCFSHQDNVRNSLNMQILGPSLGIRLSRYGKKLLLIMDGKLTQTFHYSEEGV